MIQYYNPYFLICTFFGLGKISKKFPGTIGSIIAIPISHFIVSLSRKIQEYITTDFIVNSYTVSFLIPVLIVFILFLLGTYASHRYSLLTKQKDGQEIIIDEVVGQSLCLVITIPLTFTILYSAEETKNILIYYDLTLMIAVLCNLLLFRIFDIAKPWPIDICDKKIKGGFGIMADDILAAIFAIVVYLAIFFIIIDFV